MAFGPAAAAVGPSDLHGAGLTRGIEGDQVFPVLLALCHHRFGGKKLENNWRKGGKRWSLAGINFEFLEMMDDLEEFGGKNRDGMSIVLLNLQFLAEKKMQASSRNCPCGVAKR